MFWRISWGTQETNAKNQLTANMFLGGRLSKELDPKITKNRPPGSWDPRILLKSPRTIPVFAKKKQHLGNSTPRRFLRSGAQHSTSFFARSPNFKSKLVQHHNKTTCFETFEKSEKNKILKNRNFQNFLNF